MEHDYAMDISLLNKRERGEESAPSTPSKKPVEKKSKSTDDDESAKLSNKTKLTGILNLETRVDEQLADISGQTKQNSEMLANWAKAVQFNTEEVKECKRKVKNLGK